MANLVIWNEFIHEQEDDVVKSIYPRGIHQCIKEFLEADEGLNISTATLQEDDHGLSEELLEKTDVLIWWGHKAHKLVEDRIVDWVQQRVLEGMGLVVLHSGHHSKIFKRLMGTTANIRWAERGEKERVWVCNPGHPIANGLGEYFEIEMTEMYSEPFQVPSPDETIFISWFEGGEVFRSGLCYKRGNGKIFYFRPGHEAYPVFHNKDVQLVINNAVHWACSEPSAGIWIDRIAKGIDNMELEWPSLVGRFITQKTLLPW